MAIGVPSIVKWFFGWLTGPLVEFGNKWLESRNEKRRIQREMYGDMVRHEIWAKMAAKQVLIAEQGWWVTAMIRPLFAYPLIIYTWCIVADSIYFHSGQIKQLPAFLEEWYGWIVAAYFLMRPIEKGARSLSNGALDWIKSKFSARRRK